MQPGRRISIRGTSGSGKSTLGRELARRLDLPFTELDEINHQPNWVEIEVPEFRRRVAEVVAQDGWVIDGNYRKVYDLVLDRADTVIWLDYALPVVLARLLKRIIRRGVLKEELWNGNRESVWRHFFTKESLILWVLQTHRKRRRQAEAFFTDPAYSHIIRIRFKKPSEADRWLEALGSP